MRTLSTVIIEDETIAAQRLAKMLKNIDHGIDVVEIIPSIRNAVKWFKENQAQLAFFDIQLADGLSFEIFKQVDIQCPIIFTTAYDQYAIKAFKVNSIDYLLKPIDRKELKVALDKFHQHSSNHQPTGDFLAAVQKAFDKIEKKEYKSRFIIKLGEHIKIINAENVAFFKSIEKTTFLYQNDGKRFVLDETLDQIEKLFDPHLFFRINRKYIVSINFISDIVVYSNSRLKIFLVGSQEDDAIISREKVGDFKKWLDR